MAAKYIEGEAQRERADLRQQFAASFPLDELLPTLLVENVLTDFEFSTAPPNTAIYRGGEESQVP